VEGNLGSKTELIILYSQGRYWQLDHMVLSGRGWKLPRKNGMIDSDTLKGQMAETGQAVDVDV